MSIDPKFVELTADVLEIFVEEMMFVPMRGHHVRARNTDPAWVSYSGDGGFYANVATTAPGVLMFL